MPDFPLDSSGHLKKPKKETFLELAYKLMCWTRNFQIWFKWARMLDHHCYLLIIEERKIRHVRDHLQLIKKEDSYFKKEVKSIRGRWERISSFGVKGKVCNTPWKTGEAEDWCYVFWFAF